MSRFPRALGPRDLRLQGSDLFKLLNPRALPWAIIFRPYRAPVFLGWGIPRADALGLEFGRSAWMRIVLVLVLVLEINLEIRRNANRLKVLGAPHTLSTIN